MAVDKWRERLPGGWADAVHPIRLVRLGDLIVPREVDVHFVSVDGQPSLDMRIEVVRGVPQCRELRISSSTAGREVRDFDLRAVRLGDWLVDVFARFAWHATEQHDGGVTAAFRDDGNLAGAARQLQNARKGRGARKLDAAFLKKVARIYRENPDRPTATVARTFGVSHRQASNYVSMCEDEGLLVPTARGKRRDKPQTSTASRRRG